VLRKGPSVAILDHVHAVTGLCNGSTYTYDPNGNQICWVDRASTPEGGNSQTFVQIYNADCAAPQLAYNRQGSPNGVEIM